MSLTRIETGGTQVKDSLAQLSDTMKSSVKIDGQSGFHDTLKDVEKKESSEPVSASSKQSSASQSTKAAQLKDAQDNGAVQEVASEKNCKQGRENDEENDESSEDQELSLAEKGEEAATTPKEDLIHQNELLLLSLLVVHPQTLESQEKLCGNTSEKPKDSDLKEVDNILKEISVASSVSQDTLLPQQITTADSEETKDQIAAALKNKAEAFKASETTDVPKEVTSLLAQATPLANQTISKNIQNENLEMKLTQDQPQEGDSETFVPPPSFDPRLETSSPLKKEDTRMKNNQRTESNASSMLLNSDISASETSEQKQNRLRLDELVFELRNPELAQKSAAIQKVVEAKRTDTLSNEIIERHRSIQNQVISSMNAVISKKETDVVLHLEPPDWGKIDVQMKINNKECDIQFKTEHLFVKEAIEKGLPELRQAFSGHGLQLGQANVGMGQQMARERNQDENQNSDTQQKTKKQTVQPAAARWRDPRSAVLDRII